MNNSHCKELPSGILKKMFLSGYSKKSKLFFLILPMVVIVAIIIVYYNHLTLSGANYPKKTPHIRHPGVVQEIRGFRFAGTHDGREIITIKADKFSIEKKKVGFLRFGLMNEAILKNALIRIYGEEETKVPANNMAEKTHNVTFKKAFSKDVLAPIFLKQVSCVNISPVRIELYKKDLTVFSISAKSATLRLGKRDILFKGNVRVDSGSRALTTSQLRIQPKSNVLKCDRDFVLMSPGHKRHGKHLKTDIYLN